MGILKQLMIFGKPGLQGLPTRVALFLWAFSRQGATGFPLFTTWDSVAGSGRAPIPGNISGRSRSRNNTQCSRSLVAQLVGRLGSDGFWKEDYGWGVRVRRHFGARGRSSVRYGTRLGDLKESWFILFSNTVNTQHTPHGPCHSV